MIQTKPIRPVSPSFFSLSRRLRRLSFPRRRNRRHQQPAELKDAVGCAADFVAASLIEPLVALLSWRSQRQHQVRNFLPSFASSRSFPSGFVALMRSLLHVFQVGIVKIESSVLAFEKRWEH